MQKQTKKSVWTRNLFFSNNSESL